MRRWLLEIRGKTTQCEIANKCGISQNHYSWIESGKRHPSVKIAKRIAQLLEFDWTRFYTDNEEDGTNVEADGTGAGADV